MLKLITFWTYLPWSLDFVIKLLPPINKIIKTHGHRLDSYRFKSLDSYIMKTNYLVKKKNHLTLLFSRSRVHKCVEETNQVGLFYAQKGWHIALLLSVCLQVGLHVPKVHFFAEIAGIEINEIWYTDLT